MTIRIASATWEDLAYVASWLSAADRMELAASRDADDYETLASDAYRSAVHLVALDEARPVFAFGATPIDQRTAHVWGFKTKDGPRAIKTVTKCIQVYMIPALRSSGITRAQCLVHKDNHGSRRWLAHLGFEPCATDGEIGTPLIPYQRDDLRGFRTES